jgi:hypothetical protein
MHLLSQLQLPLRHSASLRQVTPFALMQTPEVQVDSLQSGLLSHADVALRGNWQTL